MTRERMFLDGKPLYIDPETGRPALDPESRGTYFLIWILRITGVPVIGTSIYWALSGKSYTLLIAGQMTLLILWSEWNAWHLRREKVAIADAIREYEREWSEAALTDA